MTTEPRAFCADCGADRPAGARFCPYCGLALTEASRAQGTPTLMPPTEPDVSRRPPLSVAEIERLERQSSGDGVGAVGSLVDGVEGRLAVVVAESLGHPVGALASRCDDVDVLAPAPMVGATGNPLAPIVVSAPAAGAAVDEVAALVRGAPPRSAPAAPSVAMALPPPPPASSAPPPGAPPMELTDVAALVPTGPGAGRLASSATMQRFLSTGSWSALIETPEKPKPDDKS